MERNPLAVTPSDHDCTRGSQETDHATALPIPERHGPPRQFDDADLLLPPSQLYCVGPHLFCKSLCKCRLLTLICTTCHRIYTLNIRRDISRKIRSERVWRFNHEFALILSQQTAFPLLHPHFDSTNYHDLSRQLYMPNPDNIAWHLPRIDTINRFDHRPIVVLPNPYILL